MPLFFSNLLLSISLLSVSELSYSQVKIDSAKISFVTLRANDKDWNTAVTVSLHLSDGTQIASTDLNSCTSNSAPVEIPKCFCCVEPRYNTQGQVINPNTRFSNSTNGPFKFAVQQSAEKEKIKTGFLKIKIKPAGNDTWVFIPGLTLYFSDGTKRDLTNFPVTVLDQDGQQATLVFF